MRFSRSKIAGSTSARTTSAVAIFVGALLIVIMAVGLIATSRPDAFLLKNRYDYALNQFVAFCKNWWPVAGIIGIPTFLISMVRSLILESREKKKS